MLKELVSSINLLHGTSIDSYVNLFSNVKFQCIMANKRCGGSDFTIYHTCIVNLQVQNYLLLIAKQHSAIHVKIQPFILLLPFVSIWFSSHSLLCKKWSGGGTRKKIPSKCIFFLEQVWEFEYHILIQCFAFNYIQIWSAHNVN